MPNRDQALCLEGEVQNKSMVNCAMALDCFMCLRTHALVQGYFESQIERKFVMAHNELEGNVIGEVWRAQETAKELVYFTVQGQAKWFRIEYTGERMLERSNFMAAKLKAAANMNGGIEVGVDYDTLTVGEPPHTPATTFNLVKYIQIKT